MPCSRSARRPSVSSARSSPSTLRSSTWASWSASTALASYRSRPISVDLPSSTLPAVASLKRSIAGGSVRGWVRRAYPRTGPLEVALALAVFHRGVRGAVVGPGLAALRDVGGGDLLHDGLERAGPRAHGARAAHVADGAVAHRRPEGLLAGQALDEVRHRVE